ncbi:MAG TPA: hypothetical protein VFA00_10415 [Actinomycetota bacterium]|nr:hypothetical protein [Actinomycetota bacterium]
MVQTTPFVHASALPRDTAPVPNGGGVEFEAEFAEPGAGEIFLPAYQNDLAVELCTVPSVALRSEDPPSRLRRLFQRPGQPAELARVAHEVEQIRGLKFRSPVATEFVTLEEISKREMGERSREKRARQVDRTKRMLVALGVAPEDVDLDPIFEAVVGDVSGFYMPKKDKLVAPANSGESLSDSDISVLAHELEHALSDQAIGLPHAGRDSDATVAAGAVVEGAASLVEYRHFYSVGSTGVPDDAGEVPVPEPQVPHLVSDQLMFPYISGLEFVCSLYALGGWDAVNRALEDPPTTTAQVLWPMRYHVRDEALPVKRLVPPGRGFRPLYSAPFGASELLALFRSPGDEPEFAVMDPFDHAAAWGGGHMQLWERGERTALGLSLVESRWRKGLCDSMGSWLEGAVTPGKLQGPYNVIESLGTTKSTFGRQGRIAVLACSGKKVQVAIAPSTRAAAAMLTI